MFVRKLLQDIIGYAIMLKDFMNVRIYWKGKKGWTILS